MAVHCSGVTSDNGPAVNGPAVTSRNCVLDPRKNKTLDVVTSKKQTNKKCRISVISSNDSFSAGIVQGTVVKYWNGNRTVTNRLEM